jgi:hypothetical protein
MLGARDTRRIALAALLAAGTILLITAGASAHRQTTRARAHSASISGNPLSGRAMWVWYVSASDHGRVSSIVASAHHYGVSTLIVKSGDGTSAWSQFSASLVSQLHQAGLHVCAWQYVYGTRPVTEAKIGASAERDGADCLVIDAESEYEGKYVSAQTYIRELRQLVGSSFSVALASFPYVDYHPSFPYSVFLGPNGAQYNTPQMYWKDIGTSVGAVFAHTYSFNRPYGRPLYPLGQAYDSPPASQILYFRQLSRVYGAPGVSWWDWQSASSASWTALSRPVGRSANATAYTPIASLGKGAKGDLVVWAQEHLITAGYPVTVDGDFAQQTLSAVEQFQAAHGLTANGVIGTTTWDSLLRYAPASITWTSKGAQLARAGAHTLLLQVPASARLRAKRDEIPAVGRG